MSDPTAFDHEKRPPANERTNKTGGHTSRQRPEAAIPKQPGSTIAEPDVIVDQGRWLGLDRINSLGERTGVAALAYAAIGIPVFPVFGVQPTADVTPQGTHYPCRCNDPRCTEPGKHPRVKWRQAATCDVAQIKEWWRKWPTAGIGVPTGSASGWVALDLDQREIETDDGGLITVDGSISLDQWLTAEQREHPISRSRLSTLVQRTGSGGTQIIVTGAPAARNVAGWLPGVDIRSEGGYIIVPPSSHHLGGIGSYQWRPDALGPPANLELAAPELIDALRLARGVGSMGGHGTVIGGQRLDFDYGQAKATGPGIGHRDAFFNAFAFELRRLGYTRAAALAELRQRWERAEVDSDGKPFSWSVVEEKVNRIWAQIQPDDPQGEAIDLGMTTVVDAWFNNLTSQEQGSTHGTVDPTTAEEAQESDQAALPEQDGGADQAFPGPSDRTAVGVGPADGHTPGRSDSASARRVHGGRAGSNQDQTPADDRSATGDQAAASVATGVVRGADDSAVTSPDLADLPGRASLHTELNQSGAVERFARAMAGRILHVKGVGWHCWDGNRWVYDGIDAVSHYGTVLLGMIREEQRHASDDDAKRYQTFYNQCASLHYQDAVLKRAASHPALRREADDMDADPMLLVVRNGTIDLRTGKLRQSLPEDFNTKMAEVTYDPKATAPLWEAHVQRVTQNRYGSDNPEKLAYLQEWAGYTLTGDTSEQQFVFAVGDGANGKNVTIDTFVGLMGSYATTAPQELLSGDAGTQHPTIYASLAGARIVFMDEAPHRKLSEIKLKSLVGSDRLKARKMRADEFEYRPKFKLWMAGNHKPRIADSSQGIWRRMALLTFDARIGETERIRNFTRKLEDERSGILNWMIEGLLRWQRREGLEMPAESKKELDAYRAQEDDVMAFLTECFAPIGDETQYEELPNFTLRAVYEQWCSENGHTLRGTKGFNQEVQRIIGCKPRIKKIERNELGGGGLKSARMYLMPKLTVSPPAQACWIGMYDISTPQEEPEQRPRSATDPAEAPPTRTSSDHDTSSPVGTPVVASADAAPDVVDQADSEPDSDAPL